MQLRATNEALRDELRRLHEDSRAAASNLVSVAKRGLPEPAPGPARTGLARTGLRGQG